MRWKVVVCLRDKVSRLVGYLVGIVLTSCARGVVCSSAVASSSSQETRSNQKMSKFSTPGASQHGRTEDWTSPHVPPSPLPPHPPPRPAPAQLTAALHHSRTQHLSIHPTTDSPRCPHPLPSLHPLPAPHAQRTMQNRAPARFTAPKRGENACVPFQGEGGREERLMVASTF
jgi:hypothetical protein